MIERSVLLDPTVQGGNFLKSAADLTERVPAGAKRATLRPTALYPRNGSSIL